jgi:protease YdgD
MTEASRQRRPAFFAPAFFAMALLALLSAGCASPHVQPSAPSPPSPPPPLAWTAAIGSLVEPGTSSICTAILVRSDLILTAAHCLYPADRTVAPGRLVFHPNAGRAPVFDPLPVLAVQAEGGRVQEGHIKPADVLEDWLVLRIAPAPKNLQPVAVTPLSLQQILARLAAGDRFYSGGFGGGAKTTLRQHDKCGPVDPLTLGLPLPTGITVTDCVIRLGDSGGPMALIDAAGRPHLVAVISGFGQRAGLPPVGVGASASNFASAVNGLTISSLASGPIHPGE